MANDIDINQIVDKWLTYAKSNNITTPSKDGRNAEDTDITSFLDGFFQQELGQKLPDQYQQELDGIIARSSSPLAPEGQAQIKRLKDIISTKLSTGQQKQLKRELERAAS